MISPCITQQQATQQISRVRVVKVTDDPFAGLKGHDYIKARNLSPHVTRVQTSALSNPIQEEGRK